MEEVGIMSMAEGRDEDLDFFSMIGLTNSSASNCKTSMLAS